MLSDMTTDKPLGEQENADGAARPKGFRALMRKPATLISTAAMVGSAVLGVVVLGDLSRPDTSAATVASSKTYTPADGGELISG